MLAVEMFAILCETLSAALFTNVSRNCGETKALWSGASTGEAVVDTGADDVILLGRLVCEDKALAAAELACTLARGLTRFPDVWEFGRRVRTFGMMKLKQTRKSWQKLNYVAHSTVSERSEHTRLKLNK